MVFGVANGVRAADKSSSFIPSTSAKSVYKMLFSMCIRWDAPLFEIEWQKPYSMLSKRCIHLFEREINYLASSSTPVCCVLSACVCVFCVWKSGRYTSCWHIIFGENGKWRSKPFRRYWVNAVCCVVRISISISQWYFFIWTTYFLYNIRFYSYGHWEMFHGSLFD